MLLVKSLEIGHHGRVIHQGYLVHPCLLIGDDCIIDRDATNSHYHIVFSYRYRFQGICKQTRLSWIIIFDKLFVFSKIVYIFASTNKDNNKKLYIMKTITFISHYNAINVNVRLSDDKADALFNNKYGYTPIELYNTDYDRMHAGYSPLYFSKNQIKRLESHMIGEDYYDKIEK